MGGGGSVEKIVDDAIASEFESAQLKALQAQSAGAFLDGVPSNVGNRLIKQIQKPKQI